MTFNETSLTKRFNFLKLYGYARIKFYDYNTYGSLPFALGNFTILKSNDIIVFFQLKLIEAE